MEQVFHFSAPGRVELGGNHTDHQHGCVLAAAVDLETSADVRLTGGGSIRVLSEGYAPVEIPLRDLAPRPEECGTTAALVRGVAAAFAARGAALGGLEVHVRSDVAPGSGLSSSAAFEVLLARVLNALFCGGRLSPIELAQISQRAENVYFGKPCGLMDQCASASGGVVRIDFRDPGTPAPQRVPFDLAACGHALCAVDSGAGHADLTDEYAAIPAELAAVCAFFGKDVLREVDEAAFYENLPSLRAAAGDRAVLRAMHVFDENRRVAAEADALRAGDFAAFLRQVRASGDSSALYLQNVTPCGAVREQALAVALAVCRRALAGDGACRVHGGGFAGAALAFVPFGRLAVFRADVEHVLGRGACRVLRPREQGFVRLA